MVALDVAERDARVHERPLEGEGAAEQEGHEVVAPEGLDVRHLVGEEAVLVDPVAREIRPEIGAGRRAHGLDRAHIRHLDERARARVALAEEQEVVGVVPGQDGHVGLNEAGAEAGRDAGEFAAADVGSDLSRMTRVDRHQGLRVSRYFTSGGRAWARDRGCRAPGASRRGARAASRPPPAGRCRGSSPRSPPRCGGSR